MESHFSGKINNSYREFISYELMPPPVIASKKEKITYAKCVSQVLLNSPIHIDAINIPEVHEEKNLGNGERPQTYLVKMDNREFANILREDLPVHMEYIINHSTVYQEWECQKHWLTETCEKYKLHNLVLVGGDSSRIQYPGPSVTDFARYIKNQREEFFMLGGITIPSRHSSEPNCDEANRLITKTKAEIDYFTSQIIYEPINIIKLLKKYNKLCHQQNVNPKRIFLSFAPIANTKDIQFLSWLGVCLTDKTRQYLLSSPIGIGWRSLDVCKKILQEILYFVEKEDLKIPIGLNIEHISQHNFELSCIFINELGALYLHYMKHRAKRKKG